MKRSPVVHALHEFDQKGNHRIVVIEDGVPNASTWFAFQAIASHKSYYAATDYFNGALPSGLFHCRTAKHERLGN